MPSTRYILLFAPFLLAPQVQAGCSYYGSGTNNGNGNNGGYYIVSGLLPTWIPN
ncbi:MAG: hypothetical protein HZT40_15660 [Candidatus Thiothrix singaporensis]|uniref:Uncharacterized protein n=1 Tax=Candidatus Thiothrix singaporensis TaxID=2799669 RepID=A0A7L6AV30_9GAMM|nr:MAG: hypothetical protein HZT40_15660 [Candidatus Thiothrix singaporensis]